MVVDRDYGRNRLQVFAEGFGCDLCFHNAVVNRNNLLCKRNLKMDTLLHNDRADTTEGEYDAGLTRFYNDNTAAKNDQNQ